MRKRACISDQSGQMPTQLRYELKCRQNPATPSGAKVLFAPAGEDREQTLTRRPPHGVHPRDDLHGLGAFSKMHHAQRLVDVHSLTVALADELAACPPYISRDAGVTRRAPHRQIRRSRRKESRSLTHRKYVLPWQRRRGR